MTTVISITLVPREPWERGCDLDIHNEEVKKLPVFITGSDKGREDCQPLKPKRSHASFVTTVIAVTILLMVSIVFSTVTVNVLVFCISRCVFCNAVHVRCSASGFCIISKFRIRVF